MDLIGKKVHHSRFGEGVIIQQDASYLSVRFKMEADSDPKKFIYLSCFKTSLKLLDSDVIVRTNETVKQNTEQQHQKIKRTTVLTRKTVATILKGLRADKLYMFKNNPEEFISKVIKLIKEQKATMIVEHISYNQIEGEYDSTIFTAEKSAQTFDKAFRANKAVQDYVFTDGSAEKSIERRFVEDLDAAQEVCVYVKLPKGFHIPTPVGNYSPDWAIAFYEGTVKHIFFVAETKGTMDSLNFRPIEQAKIDCAKKLFSEMSSGQVKYECVNDYQKLLDVMNSL